MSTRVSDDDVRGPGAETYVLLLYDAHQQSSPYQLFPDLTSSTKTSDINDMILYIHENILQIAVCQ